MDEKTLQNLLDTVDSITSTQYRNETVAIFKEVFAAIKYLREQNDVNSIELANRIEARLSIFEAGFKQRLGATNADLGNKATKQELQQLAENLELSYEEVIDRVENVRSLIPEVEYLTGDDIIDRISQAKVRKWIPIEVIDGFENFASKSQLEDAIIEIGGKLTVLEKRNSKGYGALGGGSEGTGSLFLSRLRDVDLTGLTKNADGKYVFSGATTPGTTILFETPVGLVNDSNVTFTVTHEPLYIIVNGAQYRVGQGAYQSYAGGTITLNYPVGTGGFIDSAHQS